MNEYVMQCSEVTKMYGNVKALDSVCLNISRGRITGLLGPNGSGKTTLIKIANGLLMPSTGDILINGNPIGTESKKSISYLSDCLCLPEWMTVRELVDYYKDFFEDFNFEKSKIMLENLSLDMNKTLKNMSKGTKEKVQLVLTMSRDADLYLLDEPMGGVDPATRDYILNTIISNYNENSSVVISTHLISDVENILDDVIFINSGKIVLHDTVDNIRESRQMSVDAIFREVFKC